MERSWSLISISTEMIILSVCAFSYDFLIAQSISFTMKFKFQVSIIEFYHSLSIFVLQLNEFTWCNVIVLFGQFNSNVRSVVLRIKIKTAFARNLLAETIQFERTIWNIVGVIWKLDDDWLFWSLVSGRVENFQVDLWEFIWSDFAISSKQTIFTFLTLDSIEFLWEKSVQSCHLDFFNQMLISRF